MFLAFVHAVRIDPIRQALSTHYEDEWQETLIAVTGERSKAKPHLPELQVEAMREALRRHPGACGVLFVFDMRGDQFDEIQKVVYKLPMVEVVPVASRGNPSAALRPHLEYYGILASTFPHDLSEALDTFTKRYSDVVTLKRAVKSAADAPDFKRPRAALHGMHALRRITLEWKRAKAAYPKLVQHSLMKSPTRDALRELVNDATVEVSDAADKAKAKRRWICDDGFERYFGWHLKVSLAGPRSTANHCRVHYCTDPEHGPAETFVVGHCGEHLD
jgi:hypothetical protein